MNHISSQDKREYNLVIGLVVLMTFLSLYLKLSHFNYWSGDYETFLSNWIGYLRYNHGFEAFKEIFYNYTPLYVYYLAFISYFDLDVYTDLYAIKIFSICFEYLTAYFIGKIAVYFTNRKTFFLLALGIVPLIPSVILNSSFMAQCDAIFVSMMMGSIYFLLCKKNNFMAVVFLGLAITLKLQSSVLLPFYFVYMLRGHIKWYYFLMIPTIYLLSLIPALYFGAPLKSLLGVYFGQADYTYDLSAYFPNVYYLGLNNMLDGNKMPGTIFVAISALLLGYFLMNKKLKFTPVLWIHLAFFSVIFCPYFLPGMKERALYAGDVMVVLYVMLYPRNIMTWLSAICIWLVSFYSYALALEDVGFYDLSGFDHSYFALLKVIKWKIVCLMYLGVIMYVFYDFVNKLKANSKLYNQSK